MTNQNYETYKKAFGENTTNLIRWNYPESLDNLDFLDYILRKCKTKTNVRNILNNIENLLYVKNSYLNDKKEEETIRGPDIGEVLEKEGYEYKIITNVGDLVDYKKYYSSGEVLCTYNNMEGRLKDYHIVILSKKGLDKIRRSKNPKREDEYSTSLLNIQIHKTFKIVSIKSRYNHTVNNPDAVYSNDLDKIAEGLIGAIEKKLNIKIKYQKGLEIPNNLKLAEDFIINYWIERNNIYVGEDVYVSNDRVYWINPNEELIADQFLINFKEKTVKDLLGTDKDFIKEDLEKALKENNLEIKKIK